MKDRLPPQNLEAERGVLGACLLDESVIDEAAGILTTGDFYREAHQVLWRAILELRTQGIQPDVVSVAEHLVSKGKYSQKDAYTFLDTITQSVPHAANAKYHSEIVRQKSIRRQLVQTATEIIRDAYSNLHTAGELLSAAERRILEIRASDKTVENRNGSRLAYEFLTSHTKRQEGKFEGLSTGLCDLDDCVGGMRPQQMILVAARPGQGKTSMALNIGKHVASKHATPVLVISLEMSAEELTERWISTDAMIDSRLIRTPKYLRTAELERITMSTGQLAQSTILINDTAGQTVGQIAANARRIKASTGLGLVVIDYLGYVNSERSKGESDYSAVSRVSKLLKQSAKEIDVPFLVCHQLSRKSEDRNDRRPRMSDLRDSGQIEADADVVILLHTPGIERGDDVCETEAIVAKNRNGPTGTVKLTFSRKFTRFDCMARPNQKGGY